MVSTMKEVDTMDEGGTQSTDSAQGVIKRRRNGRRVFSAAHKDAIVRQCLQPGVSVAGIALAHGINANLVRKWIGKRERGDGGRLVNPAMVPVQIGARPTAAAVRARATGAAPCIEIELRGARITVSAGVEASMLRAVVQVLNDVLPC
jgi:transposase